MRAADIGDGGKLTCGFEVSLSLMLNPSHRDFTLVDWDIAYLHKIQPVKCMLYSLINTYSCITITTTPNFLMPFGVSSSSTTNLYSLYLTSSGVSQACTNHRLANFLEIFKEDVWLCGKTVPWYSGNIGESIRLPKDFPGLSEAHQSCSVHGL